MPKRYRIHVSGPNEGGFITYRPTAGAAKDRPGVHLTARVALARTWGTARDALRFLKARPELTLVELGTEPLANQTIAWLEEVCEDTP